MRRARAVALALAGSLLLSASVASGAEPVPTATLGPWTSRLDPGDTGLGADWARGVPGTTATAVPDVPNAWPIAGPAGERNQAGSVGWWTAPLQLSAAGDYAVRVGSANQLATVWLDGVQLCTHRGAYLPFTCAFRATRAGAHRLVIRADWREPDLRRAGYDRAWFNWGGLAWPVTVAPRPATRLELTSLSTTLRGHGADVRLAVRSTGTPKPIVARLRGFGHAYRFTIPAGGGVVHAPLPEVEPWSPARPRLYDLSLSVDGDPAATVQRRVGLRQVTWSGGRLRLNGRPLRLHGAGLPPDAAHHGDGLTAEDQDRLVDELRSIGANATRSQLPLSDEMLDRLDAAGILVWQAVGAFDHAGNFLERTAAQRQTAIAAALETADREAAHPSVLAWNLANEVSGQGNPAGQARYVDALARALHRRDPGRPVAADLWGLHLPKRAGPIHRHLDLVGLTQYVGFYDLPGRPVAQQDALVRARVSLLRRLFPHKPLVITEFGANANGDNPTTHVGGYRYQARLLAHQIGLYRRLGVAGAMAWVLRDYAVEPTFAGGANLGQRLPRGTRLTTGRSEKGLFRMDGSAKPAVSAVRQAER